MRCPILSSKVSGKLLRTPLGMRGSKLIGDQRGGRAALGSLQIRLPLPGEGKPRQRKYQADEEAWDSLPVAVEEPEVADDVPLIEQSQNTDHRQDETCRTYDAKHGSQNAHSRIVAKRREVEPLTGVRAGHRRGAG